MTACFKEVKNQFLTSLYSIKKNSLIQNFFQSQRKKHSSESKKKNGLSFQQNNRHVCLPRIAIRHQVRLIIVTGAWALFLARNFVK